MGRPLWLSHQLEEGTPAYGGGAGFEREPVSRIADGGSANSSRYAFPNHLGTHLDAPRHFFDAGATLSEYGPESWIFDHPVLVDLPCAEDHLFGPSELEGKVPAGCDLLLIRTGFERYRAEERYWARNPGPSAALGGWLREKHPSVRALGLDLISVTARAHREEGRGAHRAFLDPAREGRPLLLIEDMALAAVSDPLRSVVVLPLRVREADGGPCTVLGWQG
jgi:arylformamidase